MTVGEAIRSLLGAGKLGEQIEQAKVVAEWPRIVGGQIASVTDPRGVTVDGTLLVQVKSNAWMTELSLREPEIVRAIILHLPTSRVARIRWLLWR